MDLRKLIEEADAKASQIFNETGELLPMWDIATGEGHVVIPAPPELSKDETCAVVRALLKEVKASSCVFMTEAWILDHRIGDGLTEADIDFCNKRGVRAHPKSVEAITYMAEDYERALTAQRVIARDAEGTPTLGPLEILSEATRHEGRFVGMMPPRGTAQ